MIVLFTPHILLLADIYADTDGTQTIPFILAIYTWLSSFLFWEEAQMVGMRKAAPSIVLPIAFTLIFLLWFAYSQAGWVGIVVAFAFVADFLDYAFYLLIMIAAGIAVWKNRGEQKN